ncbi:MAG: DUF4267 domain-containing protein, partial [Caulobacteraceae bacterium]|nr:DUF4267 domain-containing protein [Caulobacter sp.]
MHHLASGLAVLLAAAIIVIGINYLARPRAMAASFGLPLPGGGPETDSWLRLKGVRDVASGLAVLVLLGQIGTGPTGWLLLALAAIPLGDMLVVLGARGSAAMAYGMHGA